MKWFTPIALVTLCGFVGQMAYTTTSKLDKIERALAAQASSVSDAHLAAQESSHLAHAIAIDIETMRKQIRVISHDNDDSVGELIAINEKLERIKDALTLIIVK